MSPCWARTRFPPQAKKHTSPRGALAGSRGDIAIAITGFAGPGGDGDEEGLVHFACARHGFAVLNREAHFGAIGRAGVRRASLEVALKLIEEALNL